ncbi:MAG: energy transducer TonB [Acidobacteria bacterium]|nr:energy transducer TonB [Acidobacteriota bacterium]
MRRSFTVVSIVVHAFVVAAVGIAQLLAVGPLPAPHAPLTFAGAIPIRVIDIPLPPQRRSASAAPAASSSAAMATPLEAPNEIGAERSSPHGSTDLTDNVGVERGISSIDGFGHVEAIEHVPPPAPPPQAPVRLHAGMQPPRKLVHVDPIYPQMAQSARVEGTVILDTVIGTDGRVTSVRVLRSIPLLDQAAMDAVKRWSFTPTLLNGTPVPVAMTVTVRFALTSR